MTLKERIETALEKELGAFYDEEGIKTGDITPSQKLRWDTLINETAALFHELLAQNMDQAETELNKIHFTNM